MPQAPQVQVLTYRRHRLELQDGPGDGWSVVIHSPPEQAGLPEVLRNNVPQGLKVLLGEARARVDRRLDGPAYALD